MGANYLVPIPTSEEIAELESVVQARLDSIQQTVIHKEKIGKKTPTLLPLLLFASVMLRLTPLLMALAERAGLKHNFYSDSKCTGCGTCEGFVCPQK